MAKSKNNVVTHGLSGKVGDILVFRQLHGETVVAKAPRQKTAEDTPKQKAHKLKFQEAVVYGKSSLADPVTKELYRDRAEADPDKGLSAYTVAVADFLNAPEITEIDISDYNGKSGDMIRIKVTDDFDVKTVTVRIENADGTLVEEGAALEAGITWDYTATKNSTDLSGAKIIVRATDLPDNLTEKTENL
ncbi:hypothetical protein [Chryseobacterium sp.]|uniref:hypothetical protein n=1 Tax=Chryseobacterium sp. TaxID=1871047 RepID=UPI0011CB035E|nr:hypothetical protein [Chryseobacterium sp.]TXF79239.1 hypothetical protein FUA25_02255 [Chryseobacterium sp.]